jgi:hypothetical protein
MLGSEGATQDTSKSGNGTSSDNAVEFRTSACSDVDGKASSLKKHDTKE